jgi:hypothetical protein
MYVLDQVASSPVERNRVIESLHRGFRIYTRIVKSGCFKDMNSEVKRIFPLIRSFADERQLNDEQNLELCVICLFDDEPQDFHSVILNRL